jgi:hypothetical protein
VGQESPKERAPSRDAVYDQLLVNDYALGLTQARVAFKVSMSFPFSEAWSLFSALRSRSSERIQEAKWQERPLLVPLEF